MEDEINQDENPVKSSPGEHKTTLVGIGASAGGLEALQRFFDSMPNHSELAFAVIQHLSPDYKSLMVELLSKHTEMKVVRAEDGIPVEPNQVYLIPPKKHMTVFNGALLLTDIEQRKALNLPIDIFFRSLAEDMGEKSIGVILSGTGSDGTRGMRAIKEAGGMTMVQDESSAKFYGMPGSTIASGLADYILPPEEMPEQLLKYISHPYVSKSHSVAPSPLETEDQKINKIIAIIRKNTGVDFSAYKPTTIVRRIERRMGIVQVKGVNEYIQYINQSAQEATILYKDLLIGVTKFFRNPEAFQKVEELTLEKLSRRDDDDGPIRVWVVGCSTGEEAYSLAIMIQEYLEKLDAPFDFKVFATDIDKSSIEFASAGIYPESIAADMPAPFLQKYFSRKEDSYQIKRSLRDKVIFASQNIIKDPPFTRIDLISCRNLLIYLQSPTQKKILLLFQFSLKAKGFLFLGSSETIGELTDAFETVDSKWRIYRQRVGYSPRNGNSLNFYLTGDKGSRSGSTAIPGGRYAEQVYRESRIIDKIQAKILKDYVTSCLIVDSQMNLVHMFGKPIPFLVIPPGKVSLDILKLLPKEISMAVAIATKNALDERQLVQYKDVRLDFQQKQLNVNLRVELYQEQTQDSPIYLIFIESFEAGKDEPSGQAYDVEGTSHQRIMDLEKELQISKENLQATIEELETSNEELQATNEELLAANEELQSTNEELESVNEELYTVNSEYQSKITELTELNNDIDNLLRSSNVGTIFLDEDLSIRKFTPAVVQEIPLRQHDIDRPLEEISHPMIPAILDAARQVTSMHTKVEKTVQSHSGNWFLMSVVPYVTAQQRVEGVVINLVSVSHLKSTETALRESQNWLNSILAHLKLGICVTNEEGIFVKANPYYCKFYGYKEEDLLGRHFTMVVPEENREFARVQHDDFIRTGEEVDGDWEVVKKDGNKAKVSVQTQRLRTENNKYFKVTIISPNNAKA